MQNGCCGPRDGKPIDHGRLGSEPGTVCDLIFPFPFGIAFFPFPISLRRFVAANWRVSIFFSAMKQMDAMRVRNQCILDSGLTHLNVSWIYNLRRVNTAAARNKETPAECNSAIQQIENLRYGLGTSNTIEICR
jgi:hypothetical protein